MHVTLMKIKPRSLGWCQGASAVLELLVTFIIHAMKFTIWEKKVIQEKVQAGNGNWEKQKLRETKRASERKTERDLGSGASCDKTRSLYLILAVMLTIKFNCWFKEYFKGSFVTGKARILTHTSSSGALRLKQYEADGSPAGSRSAKDPSFSNSDFSDHGNIHIQKNKNLSPIHRCLGFLQRRIHQTSGKGLQFYTARRQKFITDLLSVTKVILLWKLRHSETEKEH